MTHLVYGIDDTYLPPCLVSIYSALKTATDTVSVTVLTSGPDKNIRSGVDSLSERFPNAWFDVREFAREDLAEYEQSEHAARYPPISMTPLYIPWMIEEKCIFLDADTLVLRDLSELYHTDLQGSLIGACMQVAFVIAYRKYFSTSLNTVLSPARSRRRRRELLETAEMIGHPVEELTTRYFNSGVIVMDTAAIREADPSGDRLGALGTQKRWATLQDMERLNVYFDGEAQHIDMRWNFYRDFSPLNLIYVPAELSAEIKRAKRSPGILHYPGIFVRQPWQRPWFKNRKRYRLYRRVCREVEESTGISVIQMFNDRLETS